MVDQTPVMITFENRLKGDPGEPVPEAPALFLLGIGLLGIAAFITIHKYKFTH